MPMTLSSMCTFHLMTRRSLHRSESNHLHLKNSSQPNPLYAIIPVQRLLFHFCYRYYHGKQSQSLIHIFPQV